MTDKIKKRETTPVYCPCCTEKKGGKAKILCVVDEKKDIIVRCRDCKTDINVSRLLGNESPTTTAWKKMLSKIEKDDDAYKRIEELIGEPFSVRELSTIELMKKINKAQRRNKANSEY